MQFPRTWWPQKDSFAAMSTSPSTLTKQLEGRLNVQQLRLQGVWTAAQALMEHLYAAHGMHLARASANTTMCSAVHMEACKRFLSWKCLNYCRVAWKSLTLVVADCAAPIAEHQNNRCCKGSAILGLVRH